MVTYDVSFTIADGLGGYLGLPRQAIHVDTDVTGAELEQQARQAVVSHVSRIYPRLQRVDRHIRNLSIAECEGHEDEEDEE
jgi:hypothetical protein